MLKFLTVFQSLLVTFLAFGRISRQKLAQPVMLASCVTFAYAMLHVSQQGSFLNGLRSAFIETETDRMERQRIQEQSMLQVELRQYAAANKLIDQLLQTMLDRATGASRVRLNVIHNGVTGLTGTGLLRYDTTNTAAAAGRLPGAAVINQPLSEWSDFLPTLIAGQCSIHRITELSAVALRARFEAFGAASVLVCPAADVQGRVVGAVFVFWDNADRVPAGADLRTLMVAEQHLGAQIAAVLNLQGPPPWPSVVAKGE
jgi:hypothetical protein